MTDEQRKRNAPGQGRPAIGKGRTLRTTITITPDDYEFASTVSGNLSEAVRMAFAALRREGEAIDTCNIVK